MANALHFTDGGTIRIQLVNQGITLYEKNTEPTGVEGGDPIETTTNDNGDFRSFAPRKRKQRTPTNVEVTYDSTDYEALEAAVDQSDDILVTWPNDATKLEPGWLRSVKSNTTTDGEQPTAAIVIEYHGEEAT